VWGLQEGEVVSTIDETERDSEDSTP
jgi:hypothetical protein